MDLGLTFRFFPVDSSLKLSFAGGGCDPVAALGVGPFLFDPFLPILQEFDRLVTVYFVVSLRNFNERLVGILVVFAPRALALVSSK